MDTGDSKQPAHTDAALNVRVSGEDARPPRRAGTKMGRPSPLASSVPPPPSTRAGVSPAAYAAWASGPGLFDGEEWVDGGPSGGAAIWPGARAT